MQVHPYSNILTTLMDTTKLSLKLKNKAKELNTDAASLVMADLISIGYSEADAYAIAYPERMSVYSLQQTQSLRDGIVQSKAFMELLDRRKDARIEKRGRKPKGYVAGDDIELIDTTETAKELLRVINNLDDKSKEKGQLLVAYSEMMRKNSQKLDDEEDPVRIYLPISCLRCALYQNYLEEQKQN